MSTVAEIEQAIAKLPPEKVEELVAWLDDYRRTLQSAEATFQVYETEENAPT